MGKPTGFLEYQRQSEQYEPVTTRRQHYREFVLTLSDQEANVQGARCMDCGIPFCSSGCPVNNIIPDWNDLVYRNQWQQALNVLHSTNNFPDFTGRICPAPCEAACTLNINNDPVGIKSIEHAIVDKGWAMGWITPQPAPYKTGKRIAIVGSGPAGMAAAQQLARVGHSVVVFEKNDRIGGLMRYGIPDFKFEKTPIDRRVEQMEAEGVEFRVNQSIGGSANSAQKHLKVTPVAELIAEFDAVILAGGAELPRDLPVPGRELQGVHYAMEFLPQQNRINAGDKLSEQITATGKHVVVIGGGDTGSDCVGTSNRQGALSVTQFELMAQPPESENKALSWPYWPLKMRTSSSHEEGCARDFAVTTKALVGGSGENSRQVTALQAAHVEWQNGKMQEVPNSAFEIKADLVLLAMGFVAPVKQGMLEQLSALGLKFDTRNNVKADSEGDNSYATSVNKVFAAGDMRRGQSLVVWAIREGRQCARAVDLFLMGTSNLPR